MKTVIEEDEFLGNVKLLKSEKEFIKDNVITFSGLEKIFNNETIFDYNQSKLLIQNYLFQKNFMIRMKFRKLEKEVIQYNKATDMAKQLEIKKTLNENPLTKIKIDLSEVSEWD